MKSILKIISSLVSGIHHYLIWIIIASYLVATVLPELGIWIRNIHFGQTELPGGELFSLPLLMLSTLLFNAGLGVKLSELQRLLHQPALLITGVIMNSLTPLIFIMTISFMMQAWHDSEEVQQILVGLALVASMPIAGASTAWSQNANGNLALSLGLVLLTTFLSPLLTPLVLQAVGLVTSGDYSEDLNELAVGSVVSFLGIWVILPSCLGIVTRRVLGEARFADWQPVLKLVNLSVLILLNYSNASLTLPKAFAEPDPDFLILILAIVASLCIISFASGYLLARFFRAEKQSMVALMFGLGMNNNGTGLVLASVALADHPEVMLPIIFYNLVQHLIASLFDHYMFSR